MKDQQIELESHEFHAKRHKYCLAAEARLLQINMKQKEE